MHAKLRPVALLYVPAGHGKGLAEPAGQYEPAGQMVEPHWLDEAAPETPPKTPLAHAVGNEDPAGLRGGFSMVHNRFKCEQVTRKTDQ